MRKIILSMLSMLLLFVLGSVFSENKLMITDVKVNKKNVPKYSMDGEIWTEIKKGDAFIGNVAIAIPEKTSIEVNYNNKKKTFEGFSRYFLSEIINDLSNESSADENFFVKLKNIVFKKSGVVEGATRNNKDNVVDALLYGGIPVIKAEKTIQMFRIKPKDEKQDYLEAEVKGKEYAFSKSDMQTVLAIKEFAIEFVLMDKNNKIVLKDYNFTVLNDQDYEFLMNYQDYSTIKGNLYSSKDFIDNKKIKNFVGNVELNIE